MIKGLIFDLGGTLLKFEGDWPTVAQQGAEDLVTWYVKKKRIRLEREPLVQAILKHRQAGLAQAAETLQEFTLAQAVELALADIEAPKHATAAISQGLPFYFQAEEQACTPFSEARDVLKKLYLNNLRLGIFSNAPDDPLVQRLVNRSGFRPWVSPVFSSAALGYRKPHPSGFQLIAERWNLPPEQIAVIGDTLSADILGAQRAGMVGILATMTENPQNAQHQDITPTATIANLSELPALLAEL